MPEDTQLRPVHITSPSLSLKDATEKHNYYTDDLKELTKAINTISEERDKALDDVKQLRSIIADLRAEKKRDKSEYRRIVTTWKDFYEELTKLSTGDIIQP